MWLLLTGAVGDAVLAGERSPLPLLGFYFAVTALTFLALWIWLQPDPSPRPRPRVRWHHD
jgi:hypothetical protein